jgi:hypothetical protein
MNLKLFILTHFQLDSQCMGGWQGQTIGVSYGGPTDKVQGENIKIWDLLVYSDSPTVALKK